MPPRSERISILRSFILVALLMLIVAGTARAAILGWIYHFSNGATFGVMYVAMIGSPTRRHWAWAVVMALAVELGMLLTPYPQVFNIPVTARFVTVTVAAHAIFGIGLGRAVRWLAALPRLSPITPRPSAC